MTILQEGTNFKEDKICPKYDIPQTTGFIRNAGGASSKPESGVLERSDHQDQKQEQFISYLDSVTTDCNAYSTKNDIQTFRILITGNMNIEVAVF